MVIFRVYVDLPEGMRYGLGLPTFLKQNPKPATFHHFTISLESDLPKWCSHWHVSAAAAVHAGSTPAWGDAPGTSPNLVRGRRTLVLVVNDGEDEDDNENHNDNDNHDDNRTRTMGISKVNGRGLANHFWELKWALRKCHFWSFNVRKPADLATYPIISVSIYYDHPIYSCIILHTWWFLSLLKILFVIRISEYPINIFTIVIILIHQTLSNIDILIL